MISVVNSAISYRLRTIRVGLNPYDLTFQHFSHVTRGSHGINHLQETIQKFLELNQLLVKT